MSDIAELFARTPPLAKEELAQIVQYYRDRRKQFVLGVKPEPKAKGKNADVLKDIGKIEL